MKKTELALLLGLLAAVALAAFQLPFSADCARVRADTFRLHVVANSDSDEDQAVKLRVRDAVLERASRSLGSASDAAQAAETALGELAAIEAAANAELAKSGVDYRCRASVREMYFEQRQYGGVTLPAGRYRALRVELGAAGGHNWWCVVYPSLCLPAAAEDAAEEYDEGEREVVENGQEYVFRFRIEELFQKLFAQKDEEPPEQPAS